MLPAALVNVIEWGANVAFWASCLFLFGTSFFWPWWKSSWGANIIALEFALVLAIMPFVLSYDFGIHIQASLAYGYTEAVSLWMIAVIVIWRGILIFAQQQRGAAGQPQRRAFFSFPRRGKR
jgi:hypothetical protein